VIFKSRKPHPNPSPFEEREGKTLTPSSTKGGVGKVRPHPYPPLEGKGRGLNPLLLLKGELGKVRTPNPSPAKGVGGV